MIAAPPPNQPVIRALEDHLGYWLRFVSNHVSHRFQQRVEAEGVTVSEWVMLREIYGQPEVSPTDLTERTGMSKGAVSKLLNRLIEKELVVRTVDVRDRRNHAVHLTAAAEALVPRLARCADENDAAFFGHLSEEEQRQLREMLRSLVVRHELKQMPIE